MKNNLLHPLICFIGADGSGKTTLAVKLVTELDLKGYPTKYVWFRFPRFFTFIILFVSKFTNFTKYTEDGDYRIALHPFHMLPFRVLYPLTVLFDTIIYYFLKVWTPLKLGYIVVCDRWIHDILIDVAIDTSNSDFIYTLIGRLLYRFAPKANLILLLDAADQTLNERRPEGRLDPYTEERRSLYRSFGNSSKIYLINSDVRRDIMWKNVLNLIERRTQINFKARGSVKVYANVKSPVFQRLLKNKYIMLASNWTFQGLFIAAWGERIFRFMLDLIFALTIFTLFSFHLTLPTAIISSIIIAHTVNWTFNGNIWAILKHSGKKCDVDKKIEFLRTLEERAINSSESSLAVIAFGSLSRGQFSETSDIDIRIVRKPNMSGYITANIFALHLRSTAFIKRIPLDLFVLDDINQLKTHIRPEEPPVIISDPGNVISGIYNHSIPFNKILRSYRMRAR